MPRTPAGVRVVDYATLPDPPWSEERLSDTRNAVGVPPFPLLYLWIYERPDGLCAQLVTHGWVCLGRVHLLVSPDARVSGPIMRSREDIEQAIQGFATAAGRYACPQFIDYEQFHAYFGYPINFLWCRSAVWQDGFEQVADRCTRFVVDLTTEERPTGLLFELSYLFNRVSAEDIVLLIDAARGSGGDQRLLPRNLGSDGGGLRQSRGRPAPPPLISYRSTALRYLAQATRGQWTGRCTVPLARRAAHFSGWDRP